MIEKKEKEQQELELMMMKRIKTDQSHVSRSDFGRGDGGSTPLKSLNASFS